jgi:nucleoside-diphosphate-sugar epimerase
VNIGSEEMISINDLAGMIMKIAGKRIDIRHIPGPTGVRGRTSDNRLLRDTLGWAPGQALQAGIVQTYAWIEQQVQLRARASA